jgi:hypothetical protein
MNKYLYLGSALACTLMLGGCVPMTPRQPLQRMSNVAPQSCSCQAQCDALWAVGMQELPSLTGMRIRIATDSMAETYVSNDAGRMTGTMNKVPTGNGTYEIQVNFVPWVSTSDLDTLAYNGQMLFNTRLQDAKATSSCQSK